MHTGQLFAVEKGVSMRETEKMAGSGYVAAGERRSARRLDAYSAPATPPVVPVASSAPVKTVADKRELQKLRRDLETKKALERWRSRAARGPLTPDELAQLFADGPRSANTLAARICFVRVSAAVRSSIAPRAAARITGFGATMRPFPRRTRGEGLYDFRTAMPVLRPSLQPVCND